jgi:CheY-like chemotaxis protein
LLERSVPYHVFECAAFALSGGVGARFVKASLNGLTVLVVEDDWLVRADIVLALLEEGWTVLEAATGTGAVNVLRETKTVDLLITDIRLADAMTGWDVAEAFRILHPKAPVIYASGNPNNDERRVAGSVFLSKPVAISGLWWPVPGLVKGMGDPFKEAFTKRAPTPPDRAKACTLKNGTRAGSFQRRKRFIKLVSGLVVFRNSGRWVRYDIAFASRRTTPL